METEKENKIIDEIEEEDEEEKNRATESTPLISSDPKSVKTKVSEVEIHLYRRGRGPIDVFKSNLAGWEQDQLDVREILDKYGFKSIFAFSPGSGRGVPIRFNQRNGRSLLCYKDGSVVYVDGEPKDSLIKPITKILFGIAVITFIITLILKDPPELLKKLDISRGNCPPWVLACIVIVFTRMRKRTRDFLQKFW
ncbi:hypothetical protein ACOSQ2_009748 [Xanthoceras sorbifolium]